MENKHRDAKEGFTETDATVSKKIDLVTPTNPFHPFHDGLTSTSNVNFKQTDSKNIESSTSSNNISSLHINGTAQYTLQDKMKPNSPDSSIEDPFNSLSIGDTDASQHNTSRIAHVGIRKKKGPDQPAYPDINVLVRENHLLKEKLLQEEISRKEIVAINHAWDKEYNNLKEKLEQVNQENVKLKDVVTNMRENYDKEVVEKDNKIKRLSEKLKIFFNSLEDAEDSSLDHLDHLNEGYIEPELQSQKTNTQSETDEKFEENAKIENLLLSEERKERKLILQREQAAQSYIKDLDMKCQYLQNLCHQESQQRIFLQSELQRLTAVLKRLQEGNANELQNPAQNTDGFTNIADEIKLEKQKEIDILKQQLQLYMEDFQTEENDKKKLLMEKEKLIEELNILKDKSIHQETQLKIYEQDFYQEREKRIELMRKNRSLSTSGGNSRADYSVPSILPSSPPFGRQEDSQQKFKEYCQLMVEKQYLGDRISELEAQGVTKFNGGQSSPSPNATYSHSHTRGRGNSQLQQPPLPTPTLPTPPYCEDDRFIDNWTPSHYSGGSRTPSEYSRLR